MPLVNRVFTRPPPTHLSLVLTRLIGQEFQQNLEIAQIFTPWLSIKLVAASLCPLASTQPLYVLVLETSGQNARFHQIPRIQMVKRFQVALLSLIYELPLCRLVVNTSLSPVMRATY